MIQTFFSFVLFAVLASLCSLLMSGFEQTRIGKTILAMFNNEEVLNMCHEATEICRLFLKDNRILLLGCKDHMLLNYISS